MSPLNIAIPARALSHPSGGVRQYLTGMIDALSRAGGSHQVTVYYAERKLLGSFANCREEHLPAANRLAWDHWAFPRALAKQAPDVVWFPHNVMSAGIHIPAVVSVMDMLYFSTPEHREREYAPADTLYMRLMMPPSLRSAQKIMAISEWTARDIVKISRVPPQKVRVIHLAAGREFQPSTANEVQRIRERYALQKPFFLYIGGIYRRKNIPALLDAFVRIKDCIPHEIILAGGANSVEIDLDPVINRCGLHDRVRRLGAMSTQDIIGLYGAAEALVFPSLFEGFGLPVLEAFACGCPVIASHATALGEIVGDAALTFAPSDCETLAALLKQVATDHRLRREMSERGITHASQFSYERAASALIELLEAAIQ